MLKLSLLLKLQGLFAAAAIAYLLASGIREQTMGTPLSVAPVVQSILIFCVYIGCLFLPSIGRIGWYRVAMVPAILAFGGGGVIGNIVTYFSGGEASYASFGAWVVAVGINAFGTVLNIIAALGWFSTSRSAPSPKHPHS